MNVASDPLGSGAGSDPSPVHVVAGAGHVMMLDDPAGFAWALVGAFDGLPVATH